MYQTEVDDISYRAAKFEENVINTTAVRRQIRSVRILLDDPVLNAQFFQLIFQCVVRKFY
jgi:hypothetical protein